MAQEAEKKKVAEVKAFARGIHISPRKVRLVVDLLRKRSVGDAIAQLQFMTKDAALPVAKLIHSAIANARHNFEIDEDRLFIKSFSVDGGRAFKRLKPRAQGRAFPVLRRTSNLNLVLGVGEAKAHKAKTAVVSAMPAKAGEVAKPAPAVDAVPENETPSRFKFWQRNKKSGKMPQLPPKQDPKGKVYTSFDRRGGE